MARFLGLLLYLAKFGNIQNMKVENLKYHVDNCVGFLKNFSQKMAKSCHQKFRWLWPLNVVLNKINNKKHFCAISEVLKNQGIESKNLPYTVGSFASFFQKCKTTNPSPSPIFLNRIEGFFAIVKIL